MLKLIGLCGREGAGKTTAAKILCGANSAPQREFEMYEDPLEYAVEALFDLRPDDVERREGTWGLTYAEARDVLTRLLKEYAACELRPSRCAKLTHLNSPRDEWREISLAERLKCVVAALFQFAAANDDGAAVQIDSDIALEYLFAESSAAREMRLKMRTTIAVAGVPRSFNGREILEYFGTDVMREKFDSQIWFKITRRVIISAGYTRVIISDVRFTNEMAFICDMGGVLAIIYRNDEDLTITDADRATHRAKWEFLTKIDDVHLRIKNSGGIDDLKRTLSLFK